MSIKAVFLLAFCVMLARAADFRVGVQTHFSQDKGHLRTNLSLIRRAGATAVREEIYWERVETQKGRLAMPEDYDASVNGAVELGIEPLRVLGGGNRLYEQGGRLHTDEALEGFARYCEFVARHFAGRVRMYEIVNELDRPRGRAGGARGSNAQALQAAFRRMKAVDPSIIVLGGATTSAGGRRGSPEGQLHAGALENLDGVSIHSYTYGSGNGTGGARGRTPEGWAESMLQAEKLLEKQSGGKEVPLYVTEIGWPTEIDRRGVPTELAAAYLARAFLLARTLPFLKGLWWYDFQDDGWSPTYDEHHFGIVRPDLTPTAGYFALADVAGVASKGAYLGRVETSDPEIWALKFSLPDGKDAWAIWSSHVDDGWQVTLRTSQASPKPVRLTEVGRRAIEREWGEREWASEAEQCAHSPCRGVPEAKLLPNQFSVVVGKMPWLIFGDLSGTTISNIRRREFSELQRPALWLQ